MNKVDYSNLIEFLLYFITSYYVSSTATF